MDGCLLCSLVYGLTRFRRALLKSDTDVGHNKLACCLVQALDQLPPYRHFFISWFMVMLEQEGSNHKLFPKRWEQEIAQTVSGEFKREEPVVQPRCRLTWIGLTTEGFHSIRLKNFHWEKGMFYIARQKLEFNRVECYKLHWFNNFYIYTISLMLNS